ncbi:MAG: minor capsid protein, partial [Treponema sp.]|nr:minor capsid protein [Treponema sp.]
MGEAAKLFTRSLLMGLDSSVRKEEFAEPSAEDIENMPYHEAVEYLKKRDVIKKVDYNKLSDKMRFRAFTASRINDGKLLERLNAEMIANVNDGKGLKDFLSMTKTDILDKVGMGPNQGWYWETVYRTNVQTAYNAGRMMGFEEDRPLALHFVGIEDARQTDICHSMSNVIRPYDDPIWQKYIPPLHFGCRSTVRAIYDRDELPDEWTSLEGIERPAKGFGTNPVSSDSWWNELESQVRQAKHFGVQGEIEAVKEILVPRGKFGKQKVKNPAENEIINIKAEAVINEIAGIQKGSPMSFDEADNG